MVGQLCLCDDHVEVSGECIESSCCFCGSKYWVTTCGVMLSAKSVALDTDIGVTV